MQRSLLSVIWLLLVALNLTLTACSSDDSPTLEEARRAVSGPTDADSVLTQIRQRNLLRVGVKHDVPKFGYYNPRTGQVEGYEIDLARRLADTILGDKDKLQTLHVTPQNRVEMLNDGTIDLIIATMTVTEERKQQVDFSPVYYTDGVGLLVPATSGIKSLKELDGQVIGVVSGSTTRLPLETRAAELAIQIRFHVTPTYPQAKEGLRGGQVAAMSSDGAILAGYTDAQHVLLPERYSVEPYAVAARKGQAELLQLVAQVITDMEKSGELKRLQQRWGIITN